MINLEVKFGTLLSKLIAQITIASYVYFSSFCWCALGSTFYFVVTWLSCYFCICVCRVNGDEPPLCCSSYFHSVYISFFFSFSILVLYLHDLTPFMISVCFVVGFDSLTPNEDIMGFQCGGTKDICYFVNIFLGIFQSLCGFF